MNFLKKNHEHIKINGFYVSKKFIFLLMIVSFLTSCVAVKEYEKININDPDMTLSSRKSNKFERSFQVYRESSSGANGGKSGGGCGCN